jgi:hypothetical protein
MHYFEAVWCFSGASFAQWRGFEVSFKEITDDV